MTRQPTCSIGIGNRWSGKLPLPSRRREWIEVGGVNFVNFVNLGAGSGGWGNHRGSPESPNYDGKEPRPEGRAPLSLADLSGCRTAISFVHSDDRIPPAA